MRNTSLKLLIGAALIATAGCAKKPPKELPPPPVKETGPSSNNNSSDNGAMGGAVVPGSRADFLAQAGTDTILFGTDLYDIESESRAILDRQIAWLRKFPRVRATIEGHCDERGTREYNLALGDRRANAAKNYVVSAGIDASRISTVSYGKERPVASGSDEGAYAQNRRAVTVVLGS